MHCAYCGRLRHRCHCGRRDSAIRCFLARGGNEYAPRSRAQPPVWSVPPQVKRRERATLRAHRDQWRIQLAAEHGERCANCGVEGDLVLDHILPIAKGGRSRLENLQLLCAECNRLKGKLMIDCRGFKPAE